MASGDSGLPPYANLLEWCRKSFECAQGGGALLPAWTDTEWFHLYCEYAHREREPVRRDRVAHRG
jgi:hypothetical protein